MVFALSSLTRHAIRRGVAQRRGFSLGGHHGPPPEWEGIDKVVRGYFPADYQLSIAILSFYFGCGILYKLSSSLSSKKPAPAIEEAPVKPAKTNDGVPALDSPAFEKFVETSAFEALLEDGDQLAKLAESA